MELKKLTNQQVAKRMYDYIVRIDNLLDQVNKVLESKTDKINIEYIKTEYKSLKQAIKEDAHYMSLSRNQSNNDSVLQKQFSWVIDEASAYGFTSSTNSKVDAGMWRSLEEARYKLTKHTALEEWRKLSEE